MDQDLAAALSKWYCDHATIRRLWAFDDSPALVVYVTLEPSSDGDDALPVWLAHQHRWSGELRRLTQREVRLQLISFGELDEDDQGAIVQLNWRDDWK